MRFIYSFFIIFVLFSKNILAYHCDTVTSVTTASFSSNSLTIPRTLAINSELGTASTGAVTAFNCTNSSPSLTSQSYGIKGAGTYLSTINGVRIYSTNIKGIGYAVRGRGISPCPNAGPYFVNGASTGDGNPNNFLMCGGNGMLIPQPVQGSIDLVFYKISDITGSGTVSLAGYAASFILYNNDYAWQAQESSVIVAPFTINTTPCDISQTVIGVSMGDVNAKKFSGIGSSVTAIPFSITLTCNPDSKISIKIDGSIQDSSKGIIKLSSSDSDAAKGVGIQLLFNSLPVQLGTSFNIGTTSINGVYNIPLEARYYQIQSTITPGNANASATFTITYQ